MKSYIKSFFFKSDQKQFIENDVDYLKNFIQEKLNPYSHDGGRWENVYSPIIKEIIDNLNESDSNKFSMEILNWNENVLFKLADPIIFGSNNFIEKDLLYCQIFIRTTNTWNKDYLRENLYSCYCNLQKDNLKLDFFTQLKESLLDGLPETFIKLIDQEIDKRKQQ